MKRYLATKQSYLFALGLALTLTGWLLSGQFKTERSEVDHLPHTETKRTEQLTTVRIQTFKAQAIDQQIHRVDRIRDRIQEEIQRGTLLIDTSEQDSTP